MQHISVSAISVDLLPIGANSQGHVMLILAAVAAALLIFVAIVGFLMWRSLNSKTKDFSNRFVESVDAVGTESNAEPEKEHTPNNDGGAAKDHHQSDGKGRELPARFESQATVDATGDASVSADDDLDDEFLDEYKLSSQPTVDSTGDASVSSDDEE